MVKLCPGCPSHDPDQTTDCCAEFADPRSQCPVGVIKHVLFDDLNTNVWGVLPGGVSDIEMSHIFRLVEAWNE